MDDTKHFFTCRHEACDRSFLTEEASFDHAQAVHTFDDIRRNVADALRDAYGRTSDYRAVPRIVGIYIYVTDIADDWVVFEREGTETDLWRCSYTIVDGVVTLGEPVKVVRRTVYDPLPDSPKLEKVSN